ncbi:LuxR C-terminal-related transcriptional regulator [Pedobacter sp. JY14-1]|uniref:LuxR C-terminal-related transcriptional regulator n=1 Tax=Pedobacter sp. JY14-1 TaxID=3034151 RepID=UPI0023E2FB23|nr:LuxR C-terminal-related transcriptional regulator [Pedobacter sp. JY14-1]
MATDNQALHAVWDKRREFLATTEVALPPMEISGLLATFFCPGPFYYYIVDFYDRSISLMSEQAHALMGLDPKATTFDDIISRVHREDMDFVVRAEAALHDLVKDIGWEKVKNYKMGYSFRMRDATGSYKLFHHQALALTTDSNGGAGKVLNVHTMIDHIAATNSNKATLTGVGAETGFYILDIGPAANIADEPSLPFTKRERQIICLISAGLTSETIAEQLFISVYTVKQHRKNILKKAGVNTSAELVSLCLKKGLI